MAQTSSVHPQDRPAMEKARALQSWGPGTSQSWLQLSPSQSKHPGGRGKERPGCLFRAPLLLGPVSMGLNLGSVPDCDTVKVPQWGVVPGVQTQTFPTKLARNRAEQGLSAVPSPQDSPGQGPALPSDEPARCLGAWPQCCRPSAFLMIPLTTLGPALPPDVVELCGDQLPGLSLQCGKAAEGIEGACQADQAE